MQVEQGQLVVGQGVPSGGGRDFITPGEPISPSATRTGGVGPPPDTPKKPPTEGAPDPIPPYDPPPLPPDEPPLGPPDVPEPATGLLLTLGGLALLRKRTAQ